jgi:hypothetical protein
MTTADGAPRRTVAQVLAEIAEVERHLAAAPPHAGTGTREHLQERLDVLRRELRRVRAGF